MNEFFRFPHTPHLAWLGEGFPREDKVLLPCDVSALLAEAVVVEEKMDGANIGFSLATDGSVQAQNRGQYLAEPYIGQFTHLPKWQAQHNEGLRSVLTSNLILFGEWCAARHSLDYPALPDWFLLFDVYDHLAGRFWSTTRRNQLANDAGLVIVPQLHRGKTTLPTLKMQLTTQQSHYRLGPLEGLVIRRESTEWCEARAKLVRPDFTQAIDIHWRKRPLVWNQMVDS